MNGYQPGDFLDNDEDDAPTHEQAENLLGCALMAGLLAVCVALAWALTQLPGTL